ncbi:tRNA intron endonuclease [Mycena belliarum]|uniref:tRNA intron endonuclease n=1 Tax=Mycena belliarum TaxID=1033014 RepID=A0AAD6XZ32_9AGAR|nr:tRNA intron endonuclease [Mycena belliae]
MEAHPSYQALAHVLPKYPHAAGCLFQAYNDILLVQQWSDVKVIDLEGVSRAGITGKKPKTDMILHVVPCSLAETLSFSWCVLYHSNPSDIIRPEPRLKTAFTQLSDPPEIYLAITSDDASIVYYKLSRGIVKPQI